MGGHGEYTNCERALKELGTGKVGRAVRALFSNGRADLNNPAVCAKLASKYPSRAPNAVPLQCPQVDPHAVPLLTKELVEETIGNKAKLTAPGNDGWSVSALQDILRLAATGRADDIARRARLLDNEVRVLRDEATRLNLEQANLTEKVRQQ